MAEPYDALANDYDWLFGDQDIRQGVAINLPATARPRPLRLRVDDGAVPTPREHRIGFHPFTFDELRDRICVAGLREVDSDFDPNADRYSLVLGA